MDEMISKKELLTETGISYGQLYRWKRKNIIPEEWFVKRAVSSGQETFFPREKILERIDAIINMKDEVSLDEMADIFSPEVSKAIVDIKKLIKVKMISDTSIQLYKHLTKSSDIENIKQIIGIKLIEDYVEKGSITLDEANDLIVFINKHFEKIEKAHILLIRKRGISFIVSAKEIKDIIFEEGCKEVVRLNMYEEISDIKFQLTM